MGVAVTIAVGGCPPVRASSHMADSAVTDLVALELPLSLRVVHALITYAMMALNSLQLLRYYYSVCPGSPKNSHLSRHALAGTVRSTTTGARAALLVASTTPLLRYHPSSLPQLSTPLLSCPLLLLSSPPLPCLPLSPLRSPTLSSSSNNASS